MTDSNISHGAPCWVDLGTSDRPAALRFYHDLFGWTSSDSTMPDGHVYSVLSSGGRRFGVAYALKSEQKQMGAQPHWEPYFAVDDCDAAAARVAAEGGGVLVGPMDVGPLGRMALLRDPEGAVATLWQGKKLPGAEVWDEPGAPCWFELAARDTAKAAAFYASILGWTVTEHAHPIAGIYRRFSVQGRERGGLIQMNEQWGDMPSHWSVYFRVDDVDGIAARVKDSGGSWWVPPFDAPPAGRIAMMADPQGAGFYIIRPE